MDEADPQPNRPWWRSTPTVVLAVTLALIVVGVGYAWWSNPIARLKAAGEPTELADLVPEPIPDEQNAAALLAQADPGLDAFNAGLSKVDDLAEAAGSSSYAHALSGEALDAARELLADPAVVQATALIDAAAAAPEYRTVMQLGDDQVQSMQAMLDAGGRNRAVTRLLSRRHAVARGDGRLGEAAEVSIRFLRLAKQFEREPLGTPALVAAVCQSMAMDTAELSVSDDLGPGVDDRIDEALAAIEDRSSLRWHLASERAFLLTALRSFGFQLWLWDRGRCLATMNRAVELADAPLHEALRLAPKPATGWFASPLDPAVEPVFVVHARTQAKARALRVRLAIRRVGLTPEDSPTAESLGLPVPTLTDPFSGEPLRIEYREPTVDRAAGWWVWSVGENLRDDDGKLAGEWPGDVDDIGALPPEVSSTAP